MDVKVVVPENELKSRLVVVETFYHQHGGDVATAVSTSFARWLDTNEQVYQRKLKVGREWLQLDFGWLKELPVLGMLHIKNDEGCFPVVNPTKEERESASKKVLMLGVLRLGITTPLMILPPGETLRFQPLNEHPVNWLVCCIEGEAKFTMTVSPN